MSSDEGAQVLIQEVAPPLLKHTSNPAIPLPTPTLLAPLGTLSILPRELRDEIYLLGSMRGGLIDYLWSGI